ncbi:MAG TPA: hypothetical protein VH142_05765 [Polyangiaceae bacterium]|jgi:hypothetical protein|nr:hypothetical protein [Polyangiaceae bacterium]
MKIGHELCLVAVLTAGLSFGCSSDNSGSGTDASTATGGATASGGSTSTGGTTATTGGSTSTGGTTTATGGTASTGGTTGTGGTTSTTGAPTITWTLPANNAVVAADDNDPDVNVSFTVTNFTLKDPGRTDGSACPKGTCGHIHILVDDGDGNFTACNSPVDETDPSKGKLPYNAAGVSETGNTIGLDYCPSITGKHDVKGEIHNDDHSAVLGADGKVITSNVVTFTVPAGDAGTGDAGKDSGK